MKGTWTRFFRIHLIAGLGLERHLQEHHLLEGGELQKGFQCLHCNKQFSGPHTLQTHMQKHRGQALGKDIPSTAPSVMGGELRVR